MRLPPLREARLEEINQAVQDLAKGGTLAGGLVTLRASQTTTTVANFHCSTRSAILMFPQTSTAAGSTNVYPTAGDRSFVITHNSTAATDKTFAYLVLNVDPS